MGPGVPDTEPEPIMEVLPYQRAVFNNILILGWNASILDIVREFNGHAVDKVKIKIVSSLEKLLLKKEDSINYLRRDSKILRLTTKVRIPQVERY